MTTVRPATPGDARTIADIQVETWRAAYVGVMPQEVLDALDVDARARNWEHWLGVDATAQFVAERSGTDVGFVSAGPCRHEDGSGEVYAIYVRPEAWGTGSGWALMDEAVAWLAKRWPEAILWVAEENPRARRFYERHGWVAGTTRVEEVVPGARINEVLYRLSGLGRRYADPVIPRYSRPAMARVWSEEHKLERWLNAAALAAHILDA